MFSRSPRERPRHLAGAHRAEGSPAHAGAQAAGRATPGIGHDVELAEAVPVVRVRRSRVALALAITLAALPILVIDNLPATAEAEGEQVATGAGADTSDAPSTTATTAAPTTSSTLATTTTAAPTTSTTAAPTTTAQAVEVQSVQAPAPPTTSAPPPAPTTTRPPTSTVGDPNNPATWDKLAQCEASGNWAMNSGNGYYGGLQFSVGSWKNVGGVGYPHQASKAEQINRGKILQARAGWGQWPSCARRLGYL